MAEHRFHTPGPIELEVKVPAGEIEVETTDGDESVVELEGGERLLEQTVVELRGRTLVVELRGKKPFGITISIGDFSIGDSGLRVKARIPHGSDATIVTASADTELAGRYGRVESKSASGDLAVSGEVEHDAIVKTVSGDVRLRGVGGHLRVQTISGDVTAGSVGGSVEGKSVSGDVRVESIREGRVTVQSVSGDIAIGVAPGSVLDVDAGSVSGELSSEVPLGSDHDVIGGDGPTLVVRGKTVSGDFKVFRAA